jgi:hypothetical protein
LLQPKRLFVVEPLLEALDALVEAALVSYGCERVNENALAQIVHPMLALFDFLLCPDDSLLRDDYDQQRYGRISYRNDGDLIVLHEIH